MGLLGIGNNGRGIADDVEGLSTSQEATASRIRDVVGGITDGVGGAPTPKASLEDEAYASCFGLSGPLALLAMEQPKRPL